MGEEGKKLRRKEGGREEEREEGIKEGFLSGSEA